MSLVTWLNTNDRGAMKASTLMQYAQVKQHNARQNPTKKVTASPARE